MVDNEIKTRCANYKGHDSDLISFIEGLGLFVCLFVFNYYCNCCFALRRQIYQNRTTYLAISLGCSSGMRYA